MEIENLEYAYFANWFLGAILYIVIRSRIRRCHPELFERLYAKSIAEHTIEKSLIYSKFSFTSSEWSDLNDPTLFNLLHTARIVMFFVVAPFALFLGALFIAIFYDVWVAL